jgi:trehalose 6-phosphate synthase
VSRLVVVSNRVALPRDRSARAGGLAVGVLSALKRAHGLWLGWSGETTETPAEEPRLIKSGGITYATIDFTSAEFDAYYNGYCNSTLWPLLHYRLGLVEHSRQNQDAYMRINARFADHLAKLIRPDDIVWVHDYQLMALPGELRARGLKNRIGFFLHIPLPGPEIFCALPAHGLLMRSLAQCDLVGFQTAPDLRAFRDYAQYEAGGQLRNGTIEMFGRTLHAGVFPIGIDVDEMQELAAEAEHEEETRRLVDSLNGRHLIIGVDRLDYSKGILGRIDAVGDLLSSHPDYRNRITFVQIAAPSRIDVRRYRSLRREIEATAGRVNGRHAEIDWVPVRYLNRVFPRRQLAGFYRVARLGLVTPLRDGMNMVAKEYVAAQRGDDPGVLVLSRFAGAAREMSGALIVNPFDTVEVAEAIDRGLRMPVEERRERWTELMAVLKRNDLAHWSGGFLKELTDPHQAAA